MPDFITRLVDWVLPPRCVMSGEIVDHPGMVSAQYWSQLNFIHTPFCKRCGVMFEFEQAGDNGWCLSCLQSPPEFEYARSALKYDDHSRQLILAFKHGDQLHLVVSFAHWMIQAGQEIIEPADIIMPVPLHRWRLLSRRYNQASLLAHEVARQCHKEVVPDGLLRTKATQTQGHLSYKERSRNVSNAFRINPAYEKDLVGKRILLIDDVYTTGSTVNECAAELMKAGAAAIDVLTIARVIRQS